MTLAVRKLRVEDVAKLQALVVENFDAIEQGLTVLDARLLLGHATIDVISVDASGSLVLGAIGFTANEEMLLKAVEAYSWCLEYPESLVRHYPSCQVSEDRPPRLLFVVERMPDAFHRKIKQLGFPEVDCVEVRHLEFEGVSAVYFETLLRLRRGVVPVRTDETETSGAPSAESAEARPAPASPRASERTLPRREPAPIVSMVTRQAAVASRVERPRPAPRPVTLPEPPTLEPVAEPVAVQAEPEGLVLESALPSLTAVEPEKPSLRDLPGLSLSPAAPTATLPGPGDAGEPRVSFKDLSASLLRGTGPFGAVAPEVTAAASAPLVVEPPAPALTVEALIASTAPAAPAPAPAPARASAPEPAKPAVALPQEFAGLNFPNDGVLTRQWMEFLNQMSSSK